ncbi:MAG: EamA family transporter [Pseudomonadota bacterium]
MIVKRPPSDWIILAALVGTFGGAFAGTKIAIETVPPYAAVGLRLPLAALIIYALMRVQGERLPPLLEKGPSGRRAISKAWLYMAGLGVIGLSLPFVLVTLGVQRVDTGLAGILTAIMPLATLVMAHFFSPGERMTAEGAAGFVLGFVGLCILMGPSALGLIGGDTLGHQALIVMGAFCYAASAILIRRAPRLPFVTFCAGSLICATVIMTPISLIVNPLGTFSPSLASTLAIIALAAGPSGLASVLMFRLIQDAGAAFASTTNYIVPVVAVGVGVAFLGERAPASALLALCVILGGVALSQVRVKAVIAALSKNVSSKTPSEAKAEALAEEASTGSEAAPKV